MADKPYGSLTNLDISTNCKDREYYLMGSDLMAAFRECRSYSGHIGRRPADIRWEDTGDEENAKAA